MFRDRLKNRLKRALGRDQPPAAAPTPAPAVKAVSTPAPQAVPKPVPQAVPKPAPQAVSKPAPEPVVQAQPVEAPAEAPKPAFSFAALAAQAAQGDLGEARHADQSGTDLEAYRERARVNGREVELAGEGLNVAEDGTEFVGPIDNESSRAAATGQVLTIDQHECISCGTCVEQTEDVFFLGEDDKQGEEVKAEVLKQEGPMDLIQDAIDACPVTCIHWIDDAEVDEHHSAGGFKA